MLACIDNFETFLPWRTIFTKAVLKTKACLVSLCHFLTCSDVKKIVVNESFKGVEVIVTGVPDPLVTLKDWKKIHHTIVHCLTVESKEMPVCVCVCVCMCTKIVHKCICECACLQYCTYVCTFMCYVFHDNCTMFVYGCLTNQIAKWEVDNQTYNLLINLGRRLYFCDIQLEL